METGARNPMLDKMRETTLWGCLLILVLPAG